MRPLSNDGGLFPNSGALRRGHADNLAEQDLLSLSPVVLLGFVPKFDLGPQLLAKLCFADVRCAAEAKLQGQLRSQVQLGTEEDDDGNEEVVKRKVTEPGRRLSSSRHVPCRSARTSACASLLFCPPKVLLPPPGRWQSV